MGTIQIDGSTPKLTIGNATAEDATILFDGNAQDFYIALDDSADDLLIGLGSTVGTTPAISIDENLAVKTYGDITMTGTTPTLTIGDAGAEDTAIVFDGNAQDFYIALDDSADDLLIGLGSTVGTTPAISIDENLAIKTYGDITMTGTTPTLTIGDAGAEDTAIVFDGNAQDFYIALDDSADDLVIGLGSTVGTTPAISINSDRDVTISDGAIDFDIASHDTSNGLKLGGTLVTATAAELNIMDGVTATAAELNIMDGVGATAAEINLIDGSAKSTSSITVADADGIIIIDGTTTKQIPASDLKTYAGFTAASITGGTDYGNISPATGDSIIMHDTSASALREITIANLGNTPAFSAYDGGADSVSTATWTKGQFSGEHYDTHSAFDSSTNYRFTVPTGCGGNYIFSYAASVLNLADAKVHQMHLYINGSIALNSNTMLSAHNSHTKKTAIRGSCMISLDEDDYVELFHYHNHGSAIDTLSERMHFSGFRLAGS